MIGLDSGQVARPAPCCNPIPGERIVGIAVRGKGVVIHAIDCAELGAFENEPDRWIDLRWADGQARPDHVVRAEVTMANDAGVLGRICTLIGEQRANITDIVFTDRKPDFFRMVIDMEVRDMEHLTHVLTAIDADSDVAQVRRFRQAPAAPAKGAASRLRQCAASSGRAAGWKWSSSDVSSRPSLSRLREAVLPKRGYRRGVEYLGHRVRRLPDTPHRIALGFACGVFSSFTPFFGLHIVLAAVIARAAARQHRRGADRHGGGQSADLSADRAGGARARAAHPRLRRQRRATISRVSDAFVEAFVGGARRAAQPRRARRQRLGQARARSSTTSSGPTSSAGCCRGWSPRSRATTWCGR